MMDGVRGWLVTIIAACVLCALAESLMPGGPVKRVGRLVCGMVLICAILSPIAGLDLAGGQRWLEEYFVQLKQRETELNQQVNDGMKPIIEERYAAYIVDKAEEMGLHCTVRVSCRMGEDGLYLPEQVQLAGIQSDVEQSRLAQLIEQDLQVPPQRQIYYIGEELP